MNGNRLVSIIMIFLDAEKFIREAIVSVFAQTYNNWELLLVDDGSTDGSSAITRRYTERNPEKVRYLEHEGHQNRGMNTSRNLGLSAARGKYIAFLDADDVWLPHKLEQQVAILEAQPEAAMVYGPTLIWRSWTGRPEDLQRDRLTQHGVQFNTIIKPPSLLTRLLQDETTVPGICSILVRREIAESVGGFEGDFQNLHSDLPFYIKLFLQSTVFVSSDCGSLYRQHPDSTCSRAKGTDRYYSSRLAYLNWVADYLSKQGYNDMETWRLLQKKLWPYQHPLLFWMSGEGIVQFWGKMKESLKQVASRMLPMSIYHWLRARRHGWSYGPPVGWVRLGSLRRITPISVMWGWDRGRPVDRYYIEQFLAGQASDIRGHVLEVGHDIYTRQFGGDCVSKSDVLDVREGIAGVTMVADLTCAAHIPSDTFECVIVVQTLHLIYDMRAAIKTLYRILKPGGVVLVTFPGISQIDHGEWGDSWYWSLTTKSARRLFKEVFPAANVQVKAYGNVLAAIALLHGLAWQELRQQELNYCDPHYEVTIAVRAVKP